MIGNLKKSIVNDKACLMLCVLSTFIFGLTAHIYGLLNNILSHDSLNAMYADSTEELTKVSVGRFLVPVARLFRGPVAIPWVIGIIAFTFIGLSVYVIVKMFDIRSKPAILLISGIMVTNITVTAIIASYVHELDFDMLALLMSCLAAYYWKKADKLIALLPTVAFVFASMALYQSYVQVTVVLIIISLIMDTVSGVKPGKCFLRGVEGVVAIGVGTGLYFAINRVLLKVFSISQIDRVNILSEYKNSLFDRIFLMFKNIAISFLSSASVLSTALTALINVIVFASIAVMMILICKKNGLKLGNVAFSFFLFGLLILGMNFVRLFSHEDTHDVMRFANWFVYILAVLLALRCDFFTEKNIKKLVLFSLIAVLIWDNILVSNTAYMKKDLETQVTMSTFNRVLSDLEERDDYKVGETEVAFVGYVDIEEYHTAFENISRVIGMYHRNSVGSIYFTDYFCTYKSLFKYYFNYPINLNTDDYLKDSRVEAMPSFPEAGYIENIDGVLVVKMGTIDKEGIQGSNIEKALKKIANIFK